MTNNALPKLITFDGEARSGKGTIVQLTKDYIRDQLGHHPMLIDAGQVFRVLVVGATKAGVDMEDPASIDKFLSDEATAKACVQLVKEVYHMDKATRDSLLYTNTVGANSAKIGARPLSQYFKDDLLKKWLHDARIEGYDVVLLDGRALQETGTMLKDEGLCEYVLGLYFVCDAQVGAMRTLGYAEKTSDALATDEKTAVRELMDQIRTRNEADQNRDVQPLVRPSPAEEVILPARAKSDSYQYVIDTSAHMSKQEMAEPIFEIITQKL